MLKAIKLVVRRFQILVGNKNDLNPQASLHFVDLSPLFVEQVGRNFDRHLGVNRCAPFLHRLFLNHAQHMQRRRLHIPNDTGPIATRACHVRALIEGGAQALARQLHQPKSADFPHLNSCAVIVKGIFESGLNLALIFTRLHVDEIDNDQSA
jgi:hypothetical protein